jgi:bifunctional UDP-N-acetylglucosamine pyrophosphorylase/glucosamine-1-phosphate N-acetyltransferase
MRRAMTSEKLAAVILAAGKGTRMKSDLPKVMHKVANRPMVQHVLETVRSLGPDRVVIVLAPDMDPVAELVKPARVAIQSPARGTGHAVMAAREALADALAPSGTAETVLVVTGDTPLLTADSLARLVAERRRAPEAAVAVLAMRPDVPGSYGRMVTGADGALEAIVEAKDASPAEREIPLCNAGVMAIDARLLFELLGEIGTDNAQGEYYLTDIVAIARRRGLPCRFAETSAEETHGINSRADLAAAEAILQGRLREAAMAGGCTMVAPHTVFLSADTRIGRDVTIGPFVVLGPDVVIEDGAEILSFSHFTGARIGRGAIVGPFARLRPGAELGPEVHIGNFVEVKGSRIGKGAKANHLTYIGDSEVGERANIGAGTITCNYDGFFKEKTVIGAGAFIGSNTALVAPVTVGAGAITGAGSVITRDVAPDALAVERAAQVEKPGAAAAFRERRRREKEARAKKSS